MTAEEALARLATLRRVWAINSAMNAIRYLYPALNVLRNRLGIRQAKNLQQAAFEMTALRASHSARRPAGARLYPICALFITSCIQDLFDWAGRLRGGEPLPGRYTVLPLARIEEENADAGP